MHRARMFYAKQNKSIRERQILYDFIHIWNLRNKTDEHRRTDEHRSIGEGRKTEREENHKRLLTYREKTES